MGLKPVVKTSSSRQKVADWIVDKFPAGYQSMDYLEPFLGDGSVLLAKEPSAEEVVSDLDESLMSIWRALRDEHCVLSSRVKRVDHSKDTFERYVKAIGGDYMAEAGREFVLRQMSKSALKKTYLPREGKLKCRDCWCDLFDRIPEVNSRISKIFMLNRGAVEVLKAFNHDRCLTFCDPPVLDTGNSDFHAEFGELLRDFRGKAIVCARNSAMYRRLFAQWSRKGLPGSSNESVWVNF